MKIKVTRVELEDLLEGLEWKLSEACQHYPETEALVKRLESVLEGWDTCEYYI